jgi:hypothetical protein
MSSIQSRYHVLMSSIQSRYHVLMSFIQSRYVLMSSIQSRYHVQMSSTHFSSILCVQSIHVHLRKLILKLCLIFIKNC